MKYFCLLCLACFIYEGAGDHGLYKSQIRFQPFLAQTRNSPSFDRSSAPFYFTQGILRSSTPQLSVKKSIANPWHFLDNPGSQRNFPEVLSDKGESSPFNQNRTSGYVSHVSHNLPGRSSMTIMRAFGQPVNTKSQSIESLPLRSGKSFHLSTSENHENYDMFRGNSKTDENSDYTHEEKISPGQARTKSFMTFPTLSRDDVVRHSFTDPPHDAIETIDNGQLNDMFDVKEFGDVGVDKSHSFNEEIVEYHSPMLTSSEARGIPGPFAPRFQVPRWEVSDEEWEAEIKEGFDASNLVPAILPTYPTGLVNINYGLHNCIHLGTSLPAALVSDTPTLVNFPTEAGRAYTLLFLELSRMSVTWLVTNIPGSVISFGQTVAAYRSPDTTSIYLAVAMLQSKALPTLESYDLDRCDPSSRSGFDLKQFMTNYGIEMVVAANYFVVHRDTFLQSLETQCQKPSSYDTS